MRSRTTDSLRLRYVAMVAISHKSISIGSAGLSCFANSAASRAIRSLSLYIVGPPALIAVFMHSLLGRCLDLWRGLVWLLQLLLV